jgi:hypothetical protein
MAGFTFFGFQKSGGAAKTWSIRAFSVGVLNIPVQLLKLATNYSSILKGAVEEAGYS